MPNLNIQGYLMDSPHLRGLEGISSTQFTERATAEWDPFDCSGMQRNEV